MASGIFLPSTRIVQPQGGVGVSLSNPLTAGILALVNGAGYDAVSKSSMLRYGTPAAPRISKNGIELNTNGNTGSFYLPMPTATINAQHPWTLAALIEVGPDITNYSNSTELIGITSGAGVAGPAFDRAITFDYSASRLYPCGLLYDGSNKLVDGLTSGTYPIDYTAGRVSVNVVIAAGAGQFSLFVNGRLATPPITILNNGYSGYSTAYLTIGASVFFTNYSVATCAYLDGVTWGAQQASAYSANPWQLFSDEETYISSGGLLLPTLSSVTYTPGTLTSSGYGVRVTAA